MRLRIWQAWTTSSYMLDYSNYLYVFILNVTSLSDNLLWEVVFKQGKLKFKCMLAAFTGTILRSRNIWIKQVHATLIYSPAQRRFIPSGLWRPFEGLRIWQNVLSFNLCRYCVHKAACSAGRAPPPLYAARTDLKASTDKAKQMSAVTVSLIWIYMSQPHPFWSKRGKRVWGEVQSKE